jgi:putative alpha-1,2-mannosidase
VARFDAVKVKIGISYTSIENARNNLEAECPGWDFDRVRREARNQWNEWLGRIDVQGGEVETRVKFYTDLWHVLLGRHKINDVNGQYPSYMGQENDQGIIPLVVKQVPLDESGKPKFHMYNSDAFWLTLWNLNVLWGLGWPEMLDEFSACLVEYAQTGGHLPRGPCAGGYSGIMRGCPATSLITARDLLVVPQRFRQRRITGTLARPAAKPELGKSPIRLLEQPQRVTGAWAGACCRRQIRPDRRDCICFFL